MIPQQTNAGLKNCHVDAMSVCVSFYEFPFIHSCTTAIYILPNIMCTAPSCFYWHEIFFSSRTFSCHTQSIAQSRHSANTTAVSDIRRMKSLLPTLWYVHQIIQNCGITSNHFSLYKLNLCLIYVLYL